MATRGRSAQIKGKNFERKVAKILSDWWGKKLRRVPNSGGLNIKGDLMTDNIDEMRDFPFHFELKNQERWNVKSYFSQAEYECPEEKMPAVIFTKNHDDIYLMIKLNDFIKFTGEQNA